MAGILLINFCHFIVKWHSLCVIYGLWNFVFVVCLLSLGSNHIWLSLDGIKLSMRYFSGFKAIDQVHIVGSICLLEFILEKIDVQFHEFLLVRGKVLLISFSTFIIFNSHVLFLFFISTSSIEAVLLHFAKSI